MAPHRAGKFSPKVFDRLQDSGFTPIQSIQEIIDNSIDAGSKNIYIIVENVPNDKKKLYIVDDGKGMDKDALIKYFTIADDKSPEELNEFPIGSKGMGGKIAIINITNNGEFSMISRTSADNWSETSYNWNNKDYINEVIINDEASVRNDALVKHIFNDILHTELSKSFTVVSMNLDPVMYYNLFTNDKLTNIDESLLANLSLTYCDYIKEGLNIRIKTNKIDKRIIPIDFIGSGIKTNIVKGPGRFEQISESKNTQKIGDPDYAQYYNNLYIYHRKKFILSNDNNIYEVDIENGESKYYKLNGITGKNQSSTGSFRERILLSEENIGEIKEKKLVEFNISGKYNQSIENEKKIFEDEYNIKMSDNAFKAKSYGIFFKRCGKLITQPIYEFKEITTGDFYKRKWNQVSYLVDFSSNNHITDKHFGVMVNKGIINTSKIVAPIIRLLNTFKDNFKQILQEDYDEKIKCVPEVGQTTLGNNNITPTQVDLQNTIVSLEKSKETTLSSFVPGNDKRESVKTIALEASPTDDNRLVNSSLVPITQQLDNNTQNNKKNIKPRKKLRNSKKDIVLATQDKKEAFTGIKFSKFTMTEFDHIDGDRNNDEHVNLQAITPNLHSIKTRNKALYDEICMNPHIYNLSMAYTYLDSPETLLKLSDKQKSDIIKIIKTLNSILNPN